MPRFARLTATPEIRRAADQFLAARSAAGDEAPARGQLLESGQMAKNAWGAALRKAGIRGEIGEVRFVEAWPGSPDLVMDFRSDAGKLLQLHGSYGEGAAYLTDSVALMAYDDGGKAVAGTKRVFEHVMPGVRFRHGWGGHNDQFIKDMRSAVAAAPQHIVESESPNVGPKPQLHSPDSVSATPAATVEQGYDLER